MKELGVNRFVGLGAIVVVAFGALIVARSFSGGGIHEARPAAGIATGVAIAPTGAPAPASAPSAAPTGPLPALDASDPEMRKALSGLFGSEAIEAWLKPDAIVRHIVAFVDLSLIHI